MTRELIKSIYTIDSDKGVLVLRKRDLTYLKRRGKHSWIGDVFINPKIRIGDNGILSISGLRVKFESIYTADRWDWLPTPLSELKEGWHTNIFFDEAEDIIEIDVVEWVGRWPFKKRVKHKNVKHLKSGRYLQTVGEVDIQTTSNYRLIGFKNEHEVKGLIR